MNTPASKRTCLLYTSGYKKSINREPRTLGVGDDLYYVSQEMEQYKGYTISFIEPGSRERGIPVSYTHLDVYKRQALYFPNRRMFAMFVCGEENAKQIELTTMLSKQMQ